MKKGFLNLVLHAHLPFVRHPEYPDFLEEDWLYEAMAETYIPLLSVFKTMEREGNPFHLTMSLTPTLMTMLGDSLLQSRFSRYLLNLISLATKEIDRTRDNRKLNKCARFYLDHFQKIFTEFSQVWSGNLLNGFKYFSDLGVLEIMTCTATHGLLPLLNAFPGAIEAQVRVAIQNHTLMMGKAPRGIWLAECAYTPGNEQVLARHGIEFFQVDAHGILYSEPRPPHQLLAPILTADGKVAVFGRDMESSREVWSSKEGYPGDFHYREFYRDVGFDLDENYLRPHMHECGVRTNLGIKYHRITGKVSLGEKEIYDPDIARLIARNHAEDFAFKREAQILKSYQNMDLPPVITSLYDAELFGHWWFEGPWFLEEVFRTFASQNLAIETVNPLDYVHHFRSKITKGTPASSSWGHKGYFEFWLNQTNDWIYRPIFHVTKKMILAAGEFHGASGYRERILNQMARETLLAQCSDWPFIMKTGTTVPYAEKRVKSHLNRFLTLDKMLRSGHFDELLLLDYELKDTIFPQINFREFAQKN